MTNPELPDPVTRLHRYLPAQWSLSIYPAALEAGGTFVPSLPYPRGGGVRGQAADPDRARVEAGRRARGKLRRYCVANRLNRLGTLTYAGEGCHDPRQARADVARFFRSLRVGLGGAPLPYVWVPEWHKSGHGLHLHFAVGCYVKRELIERAWGHGFVHIKLLGDLPVGSGSVQEARHAAGYLSKYVGKDFGDADHPTGLHRFGAALGFTPRRELIAGETAGVVLAVASERFGSNPVRRWSSADQPDWKGGPAIWAQWADRDAAL